MKQFNQDIRRDFSSVEEVYQALQNSTLSTSEFSSESPRPLTFETRGKKYTILLYVWHQSIKQLITKNEREMVLMQATEESEQINFLFNKVSNGVYTERKCFQLRKDKI